MGLIIDVPLNTSLADLDEALRSLLKRELELKQSFQMLSGTLRSEGKVYGLQGKVSGENVTFTAGGKKFQGHMNGKQLEIRQ